MKNIVWLLIAEAAAFIIRWVAAIILSLILDKLKEKKDKKPTPYLLMILAVWLSTITSFSLCALASMPVLYIFASKTTFFGILYLIAGLIALVASSLSMHSSLEQMRSDFQSGNIFDCVFCLYHINLSYGFLVAIANTNYSFVGLSKTLCVVLFWISFSLMLVLNVICFFLCYTERKKDKKSRNNFNQNNTKDSLEDIQSNNDENTEINEILFLFPLSIVRSKKELLILSNKTALADISILCAFYLRRNHFIPYSKLKSITVQGLREHYNFSSDEAHKIFQNRFDCLDDYFLPGCLNETDIVNVAIRILEYDLAYKEYFEIEEGIPLYLTGDVFKTLRIESECKLYFENVLSYIDNMNLDL